MAFELGVILLGAAAGCVLVTFVARREYLRHSRRKGSIPVAVSAEGYAPATGQAQAPAPAEPAPSPALAIYESVQPAPAPPAPFYSSSASTTMAGRRPTRTYKRRTAPKRPVVSQAAPTPEKPETEQ